MLMRRRGSRPGPCRNRRRALEWPHGPSGGIRQPGAVTRTRRSSRRHATLPTSRRTGAEPPRHRHGPRRPREARPVPPRPGEGWPVALFLHGGYWQALDRGFFSHLARGMLARGRGGRGAVLRPLPAGAAGRIVGQMRAAAMLLHRRTGRRLLATGPFRRRPYGGDADGDRLAGARPAPARWPGRRRPADLRRLRAGAAAADHHRCRAAPVAGRGAGAVAAASALSRPAAACRGGRGGKRRVPAPDPRLRRRLGRHGGGGAGCEPLHHPRPPGRAGSALSRRAAAMALGVG